MDRNLVGHRISSCRCKENEDICTSIASSRSTVLQLPYRFLTDGQTVILFCEVKQQVNEAGRLLPSRTEVYIFRAWCLIIRTDQT